MIKNRHNRKFNNRNNRSSNANNLNDTPKTSFEVARKNFETQSKLDNAMKEIKSRKVVCPECGQIIDDIASAISEKNSGKPVHFECIVKKLEKQEYLQGNDKIAYIGQGKFAVVTYENPHDTIHFKIKKTIEWENRDKKADWRDEVTSLFCQIE